MNRRRHGQPLPIRDQLLAALRKNEDRHFALLTVLEDRVGADDSSRVEENLWLVEQAWRSRIPIVKINGLEYLQRMGRVLHKECPGRLPAVRDMLHGFDANDPMVSTTLLETLGRFETLDLSITVDSALEEMRQLLASSPTDEQDAQRRANAAYGCLSMVFEEVFQGTYLGAYCELTTDEKCDILCLAGQAPNLGFLADWILQELLHCGDSRALPVYQRCASEIKSDSPFVQEAVATYVLALEGCARWSDHAPNFPDVSSPPRAAWAAIGEILFWVFKTKYGARNDGQVTQLWARLDGPLRLAAGDVLYQLANSQSRLSDHGYEEELDLIARFPDRVRPILTACVQERTRLPSAFRYGGSQDDGTVRFLIGSLGRVGDHSILPLLESITDDQVFGKDAIKAIATVKSAPLAAARTQM